jgi:hypothetical protein
LLAPLKELENPQPLQRFVAHLLTPRPRYAPLLPWIRQQASTVDAWLDGLPGEFVAWYRAQVMGLVRQVVQVRPTTHTTMRWLKTNGHTILEESIWPGKWVPILPVLGDELDINNQVMLSGIIRHAKDPMRMKNYWTSMQAEHIALSPVPPWIAAVGQLEGHEDLWESANRKPYAYLPYNPLDVRGQPVPPPIRNAYEPPIQAITVAMQGSEHDTQATMGVYNASLGQTDSRQRSGVHAKILDQASDMGTYHYADNLSRTMKLEGEMLVDLIPKVLSPQRIQRIIGDDGTAQMVLLHPGGKDAYGQQPLPEGIAGVYDLTVGTYDVTIDVGPSYATRRQEASEQMLQLVQALPQAMQAVIYKVVGNMDWDGAAELADLLKQLPGQILEQGSGNDPKAQLAQLQAMLPQLQHQLQALNQYAQSVEQQAQQLAAENKDLKQAHDLKVLEMQLKAKEVQIKEDEAQVRAQAEVEKAALARQQAALEVRREMIEAHETRHETQGE